ARRPAGRAVDQVRVRHQLGNRESTRHRRAAGAPCHRRRGNRMTMRRRAFITLFGGAAAMSPSLWPRVARAQQPALPLIGYLDGGTESAGGPAPFRQGLGELGFVEGRNVEILYHW